MEEDFGFPAFSILHPGLLSQLPGSFSFAGFPFPRAELEGAPGASGAFRLLALRN